ncbi:hypothetical protein H8E88_29665 [candidate division KSB1 bacterium]|nr:hypothetical protein [candidate division KSB1 bacterium]
MQVKFFIRGVFLSLLMVTFVFAQVTDNSLLSMNSSKELNKKSKLDSNSMTQLIDLEFNNIPLEDAIVKIAEKVKMKLSYSKDFIPENKRITKQLKAVTVQEAFDVVLAGTGIELMITRGNRLILTKKSRVQQATGKITGVVLSEDGEPLSGANVIVVGTTFGAATDL